MEGHRAVMSFLCLAKKLDGTSWIVAGPVSDSWCGCSPGGCHTAAAPDAESQVIPQAISGVLHSSSVSCCILDGDPALSAKCRCINMRH